MARIISGSDDEMLVNMYGAPSRDTIDFLRERIDNMSARFGQSFNHVRDRLMARVDNTAGRMLRIAQSARDMVGGLFSDRIVVMQDLTAFRKASIANQDYMLSHPVIERMHREGHIEGWGRTPNKQAPSMLSAHYRHATDGMMMYSDESIDGVELNDGYDVLTVYSAEDLDDMQELHVGAKVTIMENWHRLYQLINAEAEDDSGVEDPTSIHGRYL